MIAQIVVCGALFVALVGLKLMMPGHLSELRGTLGQWLVRDADFVAAFSAVGRAASGEQAWGDSLSEACVAVFGGEGSLGRARRRYGAGAGRVRLCERARAACAGRG